MYNNNFMLDKLVRQKEEIDNLMKAYQNPQAPINNFINTNQIPSKDMVEWRILNENEEVDNLYVSSKTLFISDNLMVLKGVDGSLEKWEIKKIGGYKMKEYIERIVANGKQEDMDCLSDILVELLYEVKETNYDEFRKYKNKIKGMAYNYQIDEELAKEIVENMKPLGEYWNIETIKSVIGNDTHRVKDMYVVMNSLANDYQNIINLDETDTYIKMAHAWLDDIDGKQNKVWWYFVK